MQTILRILEEAGGFRPSLYLKIENPPYMALIIESTPEPESLGLPAISIAHYGMHRGQLPVRPKKRSHQIPVYRADEIICIPQPVSALTNSVGLRCVHPAIIE